MMQTQSFLENGTSIRHSLHTRNRHNLHSAPRFMYPNTRQHRAHADFVSIIGLSNEPPTLIAPLRRNNCKSDRNALHEFGQFHIFFRHIQSQVKLCTMIWMKKEQRKSFCKRKKKENIQEMLEFLDKKNKRKIYILLV